MVLQSRVQDVTAGYASGRVSCKRNRCSIKFFTPSLKFAIQRDQSAWFFWPCILLSFAVACDGDTWMPAAWRSLGYVGASRRGRYWQPPACRDSAVRPSRFCMLADEICTTTDVRRRDYLRARADRVQAGLLELLVDLRIEALCVDLPELLVQVRGVGRTLVDALLQRLLTLLELRRLSAGAPGVLRARGLQACLSATLRRCRQGGDCASTCRPDVLSRMVVGLPGRAFVFSSSPPVPEPLLPLAAFSVFGRRPFLPPPPPVWAS